MGLALGKLAVRRFVGLTFGGCMVFCGRLWLVVEAGCFGVNLAFCL